MYLFMYVCMFVFTYVFIYVYIYVYKYVCMHGCTYVFECTHVCMCIYIYYIQYIHTYLGDREVVDSEVPEGGIDNWNAEFSAARRGARHAHGSDHETHVRRGHNVAVLVAHEVLHLRNQRHTRGHARKCGVDLRSRLGLLDLEDEDERPIHEHHTYCMYSNIL
jgi:hypothetical protein